MKIFLLSIIIVIGIINGDILLLMFFNADVFSLLSLEWWIYGGSMVDLWWSFSPAFLLEIFIGDIYWRYLLEIFIGDIFLEVLYFFKVLHFFKIFF